MFKNIISKKTAIIISIILFLCLLGIMLAIFIPKTDKIEYEIYYDGIMGEGVILRDEIFYDLSGYEKVYYENVAEGQFVPQNTAVASAYKKGYIKSTLEKLFKTEKNIVSYQNQNVITSFDDKKIQQFDFEIDVIIKQMSERGGGYIELHNTLTDLIKTRQEYIRANYNTESNTYLQDLYTDELSITESLATWCDWLVTPNDGFIGFYCDGSEQELTTEKAQMISYDDFDDIIEREYINNRYGFKIVKDSKWYVVVDVEDASPFCVGNLYPVYIGNEKENEAAYLENIVENKKGSMLIFSFSDNVEKYIDLRTTDIFVGNRVEGFCVDAKCVKNDTVVIKKGKTKENVAVNVLYSNDKIKIFDITDELTLGQKVYK